MTLMIEFSGTENGLLFDQSCTGCTSSVPKFNSNTGGATMIDATASAKPFVYLDEFTGQGRACSLTT